MNGDNVVKKVNGTKLSPQKARGVVETVKELEQALPKLIAAINSSLNRIQARADDLDEVIQAVAEVAGRDKVQETLDRRLAEREKARSEAAEKALQTMVENGSAKLSDIIAETSLLVGTEYDKDGVPIGTGRVQVPVAKLQPEVRAEAIGKGPGHKIVTPIGSTFEVLDIYEQVEVKASPEPVEGLVDQSLDQQPEQPAVAAESGA